MNKSKIAYSGRDLFNEIYKIDSQPKKCLSKIVYNLFTTNYDHLLVKNSKSLRNSSFSILSQLKNNLVPMYVNNAVFNIILDIMFDENGLRTKNKIIKMQHYYFDLAKNAFRKNDHNTTVLIKSALDNVVIKRLNLKLRKSEKKLLKKFKINYGEFINCYKDHLENIIKNKDNLNNFIPSALVLDMHLKKNNIYLKAYSKIGKFPEKLKNKTILLEEISKDLSKIYKKKNSGVINLYTMDPFDNNNIVSTSNNELIGELLQIVENNFK